jgi:Flp pilus assembly protein TadD
VLERVARDFPDRIEPLVAMGDIHRAKEKYAEAASEYQRAIELSGKPDERNWTLYYARGICYERLGEWDKAEADLTLALNLSGDHPLVLNYLGYSWIEQHHRLDEALAMIERAVEQRPNDGYIVDSLGWARYRLGEYARWSFSRATPPSTNIWAMPIGRSVAASRRATSGATPWRSSRSRAARKFSASSSTSILRQESVPRPSRRQRHPQARDE